ncbi:MAG: hypothetical protein IT162_01575 [Bryobacterales bacterium]|nr:hypothetical protein [Bryobacterales bacterium]
MLLNVTWTPRMPAAPPLTASGVYLQGHAARGLARELLTAPLPPLEAVFIAEGIVLLGPAEQLPWRDGALYLGRDAAEPRLYLPSTLAPSVPVEWLAAALARQHGLHPPYALTESKTVIPLAGARPLDAATLTRRIAA